MLSKRVRCISTRVTADEYAGCERLAGTRSLSRWLHEVVRALLASDSIETMLLADIGALRVILLNLHFAILSGRRLTPQLMQELIDRADANKLQVARERLAACRGAKP
jgi:hypothetical protein